MKTIAVMPLKLNNERCPNKNTKLFTDGTPLFHVLLKTLLKIKQKGVLDEIYVFCSDPSIKALLPAGVLYLPRSAELDSSKTIGTDIYGAFVKEVDADIYVLSHATSPFINEAHITDCIKQVQSGNYDSAFCAKKIQNFLWQDNSPVNFELDKPPRTQDMKPYYMELSTPYVFTRECWQKYNSRSGKNPYICECSEIEAIDIDYPEDFELADMVYSSLLKKGI